MNYISFIFLVISNPLYAENIPGEWVGEIGLLESPALDGNVFVNPATADTLQYISASYHLSSSDYYKFNGKLSSITLTMRCFYGFLVGGRINVLYDSKLDGEMNISNDWDSYDEYLTKRGGIDQYSCFIKKSFSLISVGFDFNVQSGKIEDRWKIDFKNNRFNDIYDTLSTYFRGYSVGFGIFYKYRGLSMGGYYGFYQDVKHWNDGEEKEKLNLKNPMRFGFSYSFDKSKSIILSADKKCVLLSGKYGPFIIGYGRIYGSGYELDIEANRFLISMAVSLNKMPVLITLENRRYLGNFIDNEYIGSISISISGEVGGNL
jgi:hypothetical protein